MNPYKTAQRLRAIATRLEKILDILDKFISLVPKLKDVSFGLRFDINSIRALADEIRPKESEK